LQLAAMILPTRVGTLGVMSMPSMPRRSAGGNRIAEAMVLLPAEEREILYHAHYLGWTVERIAGHFEIPDDIVKLRLHDALQRLLPRAAAHQ
jgi:DNA-directed RNA polymerase specialized sigma24 family protein